MKLRDIIGNEILNQINADQDKTNRDGFPFVSDLRPGSTVLSVFKVHSKRIQEARDGKKFLLLTLSDKTGAIRAIDWFNAERNDSTLEQGMVVRISGRVAVYEDRIQLNLDSEGIQILQIGQYDYERFMAVTTKDIPRMYDDLLSLVGRMRDDYIRALLKDIFENDKKFIEKFIVSPAASKVHHAYKGGLLEHTMSVAELCEFFATKYGDSVDGDLLVAGALLHDIGKVYEYTITPNGIERTNDGELVGHIAMGIEMVSKAISKIQGFPRYLQTEIKHLLLSHHGEMEWGSPVIPKTTEAIVLHMADDLDSKVAQFREIEEREFNGSTASWSNYDRFLNRRVFMKNRRSGDSNS
ncbi:MULTISPECIES: HD domain-containing protein [Mesotoga]|jgi:3'-5' exoribonuclease|uniref:3'-5' exoribonuclease YhaM family protein n=1 Tax=Mesotoga TaxID=1184396 RepID=UPI0003A04BB1|nr:MULTISPECIES: HD domain-containing protein [Mesotoga]MCP5456421.1 HD domain-containing protein [Thermotogota bacterium]MCP5460855.1 HD domain-containing protein [Thermotogota bacterium]HNQ70242.1 HD domain-containing protein [Mesotoga prima]HNS74693.1 HD domain-containing protein [Mesotoga prima]HOP36740.1 HD domain-containing protein [Mesotoga prima]